MSLVDGPIVESVSSKTAYFRVARRSEAIEGLSAADFPEADFWPATSIGHNLRLAGPPGIAPPPEIGSLTSPSRGSELHRIRGGRG